MTFQYVVTALKPTAVSHAVTGCFTAPDERNLIVARHSSLEIHALSEEGLTPVFSMDIWGRISTMRLFRPAGEPQDLLLLSTERYRFAVLAFDSATGKVETRAQGDLRHKVGRPTEDGHILLVDPECRLFALHLYDGMLTVLPPAAGGGLSSESFPVRLEELEVVDMLLLHGMAQPTLCVLSTDASDAKVLATYVLDDRVLQPGPWGSQTVEAGAEKLVAVPAPVGGVLVLGAQTVAYVFGAAVVAAPTDLGLVNAVTAVGDDRYLVGDDRGALSVVALVTGGEDGRVTGLTVEMLGHTSAASALCYLDRGCLFLGSASGDSQFLRLSTEPDEEGSFVEELESYPNTGPIVDFCVVDLHRQGQGLVVTCSGSGRDGSLRVVRSGVGISEQAEIDMPGITGLWSLRGGFASPYDAYLVQSFSTETRVLKLEGEEMGEIEVGGFAAGRTLLCANVVGDRLLQVGEACARLVRCDTLELVSEWAPPGGLRITSAAANASQVLVAAGEGQLFCLEIDEASAFQLEQRGSATMSHDVSCLDLTPLASDPAQQPPAPPGGEMEVEARLLRSDVCAVGLWNDMSIRLLQLPSLNELRCENLGGETQARSVLFASLDGDNMLLVALGDGQLISFKLDMRQGTLSARKKVALATRQIALTGFETAEGARCVFAASDRPTIIHATNRKLGFSTVNVHDVTAMASFHSEAFPHCLALASPASLTIGTIDDIQKLHVEAVPLGESPRRICHSEAGQVLAVTTTRPGDESNWVRFFDDQTFADVHEAALQDKEYGVSAATVVFAGDEREYVVVGTCFIDEDDDEATAGRVLVFQVESAEGERTVTLAAETAVRGAVYDLRAFEGKLLAGVNSHLHLFEWQPEARQLALKCSRQCHVLALFLQVRGDKVLVGDLMKSMALLRYDAEANAIEEVAHDSNPMWPTAVEVLGEDLYLGADNGHNLYTLRQNEAPSPDDRSRLELLGEFHVGCYVNRFRKGSLVMQPADANLAAVPQSWVFGAVNGTLGLVVSLDEDAFAFLARVQTACSTVVHGIGGLQHAEWRAFHNDRRTAEAKSFLDGDLIESLLELSRDEQEAVVAAMNDDGTMSDGVALTVEEVVGRVEEMARLH